MKPVRILCALFALATVGFAQDHPGVTALPNSIYVSAEGKFEAAPDTAVMQFDISAQEDKAQKAYDHVAKDTEQVREVLRTNGIEPKAANIGFFAVQPAYEFTTGKRKLIGYRVTTDVTLKLKDFSKIGPVTQQLADANVSESQTLNYILENMDEAKNKAVEDGYRKARVLAETISRAGGRSIAELSYATVDTFENQPQPVRHMQAMFKAAPAAPPPTEEFTPQNVTVGAHVSAVFTLK